MVAVIESYGGRAIAIQADMSQPDEIRQLFTDVLVQFDQLNILVNNAGSSLLKPLVMTTDEEFDQLFSLNVRGTFCALREAAQHMTEGGRIINISASGTTQGFPGASAYLATKAAVEQFTLVLSKELAQRQITVNCVSPGIIATEMFAQVSATQNFSKEEAAHMTPLGRIGTPKDVANMVAFLVSEQGNWITGQNFRVTGGI